MERILFNSIIERIIGPVNVAEHNSTFSSLSVLTTTPTISHDSRRCGVWLLGTNDEGKSKLSGLPCSIVSDGLPVTSRSADPKRDVVGLLSV
jgi:hypothetical protein